MWGIFLENKKLKEKGMDFLKICCILCNIFLHYLEKRKTTLRHLRRECGE